MTTYPIKIRCSRDFLVELSDCEEASYEDTQHALKECLESLDNRLEAHKHFIEMMDRLLEKHTHVVAQRHKTILEMRCIEEVIDVFYSICTGTIQVVSRYELDNKRGPLAKCESIAEQLRPIVLDHFSDDPKRQARYASYWPSGY